MLNAVTILDELNRLVLCALPECAAIYIDLCPQEFERPAVLITCGKRTDEPVNAGTVHRTYEYAITYFDRVGVRYESETRRLIAARDTIMDLFQAGYICVEDRAPSATAKTEPRNFDSATVVVTVAYNEAITQQQEPPLMQELNLTMKGDI